MRARRASVGTQADYTFEDEDVGARMEALARGFEEVCRERDEALLLSRGGSQVRYKSDLGWGLGVGGSGPNQFLDPRSILIKINYQSPWGILT